MFSSLRTRLVAWYLVLAALGVAIVVVAVNLAVGKALTFDAQQSLDIAARSVPSLIYKYRGTHKNLDGLQAYLQHELSPSGTLVVFAHEAPPKPAYISTMQVRDRNAGFIGGGMALFAPAKIDQRIAPIRFTTSGGPPIPPPELLPKPGFDAGLLRFFALEEPPLSIDADGVMVALAIDVLHLRSFMTQVAEIEAFFAVLILIAAWRLAVIVSGKAMEPLLRTTRALNRFGDGDFTPEAVSTRDRSELGELARAYNRAVDQITRAFDERSRAEAEMRQFVADAGHQLRTPLTVIMGHLSAMNAKSHFPYATRTLDTMLAQSRRMKGLIDDLITLARLEHENEPGDARTEINELCERVPRCFDEAAQRRIDVRTSSNPIYVAAKESDLLNALCALVDNALKYAPEGRIEIEATFERGGCTIGVADRGPGMNENDLRKAFDRFYRGAASEDVSGTGLGLAIVRKSIEGAGGSVELRNRDGGGIMGLLRLPALSQDGAVA